jgi:hypothetical protein
MNVQVKFENNGEHSPHAMLIRVAVRFANTFDECADARLDYLAELFRELLPTGLAPGRVPLPNALIYRGGNHVAVCSGNDRIALITVE